MPRNADAKTTRKTIENIGAAPTPFNQTEKQEQTRSWIATGFVGGYLAVFISLIVLAALGKLSNSYIQTFLLAIGSPLGFIIGFYFKSSK